MSQTWKPVRVFISSTFRDMHAERDYLVRFVFPELRERCAKRRLHLVDVDLRWGATERRLVVNAWQLAPTTDHTFGCLYCWTRPIAKAWHGGGA